MNIPGDIETHGGLSGKTTRRAPKEFRRDQLINATIDSLALRGYAETTLADVAEGAGLSRGIVNFHFESKEKLLLETLQFLADEYDANWKSALAGAGQSAAEKIRTISLADLSEKVCNERQVAAWFAFFAEAKSRPSYQALSWSRDGDYFDLIVLLTGKMKAEAGYKFDPLRIADGFYALQEGLWLRLMLESKTFTREMAVETILAALGSLFPAHFSADGSLEKTIKTKGGKK